MRLLYGEHDLTIDDKNRMLIPSDVRRLLTTDGDAQGLFLVTGVNRVLWMYAEQYYEGMASTQKPEIAPMDDLLAFDQLNYGLIARVEMDKQGRVLLPEKTIRRNQVGKDVTLVGVRDHLELWNRSDWERRQKELDERRAEIAVRGKQALQRSDTGA